MEAVRCPDIFFFRPAFYINVTSSTYKIPSIIIYWSYFGLEVHPGLARDDIMVAKALVPKDKRKSQSLIDRYEACPTKARF